MKDSTKRFADRVDNYVKYRPSYPAKLIDYLFNTVGLNKESIIADIGSGTGIFSNRLADRIKTLYCVEPNNEMRKYSETIFKDIGNIKVVNGTAEDTTLQDDSIDFITVAQAFHWFNNDRTIKEFKRITHDNGVMILIWNNRLTNTEFLRKYEYALQKYSTDYNEVNHRNIKDEEIRKYYNSEVRKVIFDNFQEFDFNGIIGRLLSSSYSPLKGTENYNKIVKIIKEAFKIESINGKIRFNYETEVYWGNL